MRFFNEFMTGNEFLGGVRLDALLIISIAKANSIFLVLLTLRKCFKTKMSPLHCIGKGGCFFLFKSFCQEASGVYIIDLHASREKPFS